MIFKWHRYSLNVRFDIILQISINLNTHVTCNSQIKFSVQIEIELKLFNRFNKYIHTFIYTYVCILNWIRIVDWAVSIRYWREKLKLQNIKKISRNESKARLIIYSVWFHGRIRVLPLNLCICLLRTKFAFDSLLQFVIPW